jgi:hypothetical protein
MYYEFAVQVSQVQIYVSSNLSEALDRVTSTNNQRQQSAAWLPAAWAGIPIKHLPKVLQLLSACNVRVCSPLQSADVAP